MRMLCQNQHPFMSEEQGLKYAKTRKTLKVIMHAYIKLGKQLCDTKFVYFGKNVTIVIEDLPAM